jgi:WD40 repeat protein
MRFKDPTIESTLAAEVAPESPAREVLSPDGRLAIRVGETEGSGDVVVKSSGEIVATLRAGGQPVVAVAFTPDGNWVAIADGTRNVRVRRWETIAPLDMLQARARKLVTRPLTDDERNRALSAGQ